MGGTPGVLKYTSKVAYKVDKTEANPTISMTSGIQEARLRENCRCKSAMVSEAASQPPPHTRIRAKNSVWVAASTASHRSESA